MLVDARQVAELTQTELSVCLGKPQSFVAKYEKGERRLDVLEFLTICRHLKTDPVPLIQRINLLLTEDSGKNPPPHPQSMPG